ncbi:Retrotransposable element Tf2 155 kDa protein type 2 OS=Schizosaccharomyces pombe (strain 972 / ATCC 24843) GN=Tf2-7 PE=4 SV=1 [Rhizoctonia solani AG-1 IB]|uniref:Retrotransposable element Tf2 155 kDa protein type 2 n=1 Tax=Thanatephorus cucumeris (strain AG1-IB / isolate 7/3/14) TaxID=1108050 RepID=A0A0B7FA98_THACB|nr:Retrotransposable element Tf2 155 kDa protein type 2 OS=Schizosaccharomyces pombe (strain 972 / ATCC 24843) GN=Tf2-7 PE=4 SV=1 [Rhizoctonia solani AG-1 IB]
MYLVPPSPHSNKTHQGAPIVQNCHQPQPNLWSPELIAPDQAHIAFDAGPETTHLSTAPQPHSQMDAQSTSQSRTTEGSSWMVGHSVTDSTAPVDALPTNATTLHTSVHYAGLMTMVHKNAPHNPQKIVTPLCAEAWEDELQILGLLDKFSDIPTSLHSGFCLGTSGPITSTYIPNNHTSAISHPDAILDHINTELNTGHYSNFIDPQFTCSHNIPLIELDYPHTVIGINGRQVRDSIRFKCCLVFNTQGRHFSTLFHLLLLGNCNLILGTPWLILANPDINWFTLEVLHCLPVEARGSEIAPPITSILEEFKAFQKVFSNNFFTTLPAPCSYDCAIPLEDGKDIPHGPIYPLTPSEIAALKEHIDSEFAAGKICPSTSPTGAPVMFVKRANGRLCLVVDYCCLNAITIKDYYALPRQDELNEKLRHAKILTKLDLRNGYNNNCTKEGDKWKAAFRSKYGHFKPTGMQFGLTNAPAVFQRFMDDIFRDLLDTTVIVYLDNILIFSNSREEHVQHVKEVLSCLQKHNLFCNPSKCVFFLTEVTYIGLVVTPEGISTEQEKVKAIQEWPESRNVKQVQSFLGFANFYCHFVHDFSCLARSLTLLTQKNQPWVWEAARREAFHQIKIVISQEPVLAHPDQSQLFTLETDASSTAMGAVLSQRKDDGRLHPVAFMSASFSPADLNYDMHEKELLAIIRVFEHWRIFLEGTEHPVTVLTDHKNLEYWKSARTFNSIPAWKTVPET